MAHLSRIQGFLGLRRSMLGVLGMVVLLLFAEKLVERFVPLYLDALGAGALAIGAFQGLTNLLNALYSYPGGYVADRVGAKRALLVFNLAALVGFALVALIPRWPAVLAGAVFFLAWDGVALPATMKVVAEQLPSSKRTMGVSMHSLVRRLPMALGPLAGGYLIDRFGASSGVRLGFVMGCLLGALAAVCQHLLIADDRPVATVPGTAFAGLRRPRAMLARMRPELRSLLVSDILIRFCEQIPYAFVVLWCMKRIEHPVDGATFGWLTAVEMVTSVLVYVPVAYLADRAGKKPFVVITFAMFSVFPLVLLYSQSVLPLVAAFVVRGLKEFGEPTRKALILDLCPADQRATMFGFYYTLRDLVVSLAAFGGAFLWEISPRANLLAAFVFGAVGTVWFAVWGRDLPVASETEAGRR